jgi:hypothetical protein
MWKQLSSVAVLSSARLSNHALQKARQSERCLALDAAFMTADQVSMEKARGYRKSKGADEKLPWASLFWLPQ